MSGAIETEATTVEAVVHEMLTTRYSEPQGHAVDRDESAAIERKERDGYF